MSKPVGDELTRFWRFVDKTDGCWLWLGWNRNGYGRFDVRDTNGEWKSVLAYRYSYETFVGAIGPGLQLDHLCRVPACVNPAHLEAVEPWVNNIRSTSVTSRKAQQASCVRGHLFDLENTRIRPDGHRECRACRRLSNVRIAIAARLKRRASKEITP